MTFSRLIAKRFLLKSKVSSSSKITGWIAVVGLAVGCMAMVLSLSVLNGFENRVIDRIIGFESDLRLTKINDWDSAIDLISNFDEVKETMPFQERKGLILGRGNAKRMVSLKAVNMDKISSFYDFNSFSELKSADLPIVYLGEMTARRLNVDKGDIVRIFSPIDYGYSWGLPVQIQCIVGGVFNIQVLDLDDKIAFIPSQIGAKIFSRKTMPDGIDIRLHEDTDVESVAIKISEKIIGAKIESWGDLHSELFGAMQFERVGTLAVLSLIILVACFNLIATLVLITAQKTREFGILQVLGASRTSIKSIIFNQGLIISVTGIFSGLFISLVFIFCQNYFGIITLPQDIYFTPYLPMEISANDIIVILSISFLMVFVSINIAARRTLMFSPLNLIKLEK
ncbi:MAG: FtsX-like permease family protein [Candidatus Neomarinimicrobiota bacterium]|nr:FtsX-like permease family protein [Candidatus Neomarinimicrobiota bacterium]